MACPGVSSSLAAGDARCACLAHFRGAILFALRGGGSDHAIVVIRVPPPNGGKENALASEGKPTSSQRPTGCPGVKVGVVAHQPRWSQ